jgi:hypothetical protein
MSIASPSDALPLVERKLLAVLGCEMLKAERLKAESVDRRSSSSTSSSDDSTGVSVRGIVRSPVVGGFCLKNLRGEEVGDMRRGSEHCLWREWGQHNVWEVV